MANSYPLILSTSNRFAELAAGDDLNLTNSNIVGVVNVTATGNVTTSSNISAAYVLGNGSQLTSLPAGIRIVNGTTSLSIPTADSEITGLLGTTYVLSVGALGLGTSLGGQQAAPLSGATAIGARAGWQNQSGGGTALGFNAGEISQSTGATALGAYAGRQNQGTYAIAVGYLAGNNQGSNSVVIGSYAGNRLGVSSIAIGAGASGNSSNINNSIVINATGSNLNATQANTFVVKPIRQAATGNTLYYSDATGEITYGIAYSNANVAAYLPTYTGNISAGNISVTGNAAVTGNLTAANVDADNLVIASNIAADNLSVMSNIAAAGNISAVYLLGNITQATGYYSDANVAAYLPNYSGNLRANNILTIGAATISGNIISSSGNISTASGYILGNGAFLTGLPAQYSNANVANYLAVYDGNLQAANLLVTANAVITGNLRVDGNITYVSANTLNVGDKLIILANAAAQPSDANGGGIQLGNVAGNGYANLVWLSVSDTWNISGNINTGIYYGNAAELQGNVTAAGNVAGQYILGNGFYLTGLPAGYSNADVANYLPIFLPVYNGDILAGNITVNNAFTGNTAVYSGNVTAANFFGPIFGTLTGNVLGNIDGSSGNFNTIRSKSVVATTVTANSTGFGFSGNISGQRASFTSNVFAGNLEVTDNAIVNGNLQVFGTLTTVNANAIAIANLTITVANGATSQSLANGAGLIAGSGVGIANIIYLSANDSWNLYPNVATPGNVTASYFLGNGSQLTGLPDFYSNANVANYLPIYNGNVNAAAITDLVTIAGNGTTNISVTSNVETTRNVTTGNLFVTRGLTALSTGTDEYIKVGANNAGSGAQPVVLGINSSNSTFSGLRLSKAGTERWFVGADNSQATGNFVINGPGGTAYMSVINGNGAASGGYVTMPATYRAGIYRKTAQSVSAALNYVVDWDNVDSSIPGTTMVNGVFTNTGPARKFCFNFQAAWTAAATNLGEIDLWFSLNGTTSGTNRWGAYGQTSEASTNAIRSGTMTFLLNTNDTVRCYMWAGSSGYTVGGAVFGQSTDNSCKLYVVEVT